MVISHTHFYIFISTNRKKKTQNLVLPFAKILVMSLIFFFLLQMLAHFNLYPEPNHFSPPLQLPTWPRLPPSLARVWAFTPVVSD